MSVLRIRFFTALGWLSLEIILAWLWLLPAPSCRHDSSRRFWLSLPQITDLALQDGNEALHDVLTPMLSLAVDHATQLGNGNGDADVLKAAYKFGD